jgi:dTDP-N-acetylfucosamine:lipid II N-acetylfucosaminyltransferase
MIVHLFEDEKFVNITIDSFQKSDSELNRYIVFSNAQKLSHVSSTENVLILHNSTYNIDIDLIYKDCKLLVIHYLTPIKLYIIKNKPSNVKVLWSVWGADAYDHFKNIDIFEPLTVNIYKKNIYQYLKSSILYSTYHFLKYKVKPIKNEIAVLRKIDFISTVLPYEFGIIKREFDLNAKYIDFNYPVNKFSDNYLSVGLGDSILLGNSATLSNNHFDAFDIIKNTKKKIICPLSYGPVGYRKYRKKVVIQGYNLFKKKFQPLEKFLPNKDYEKILYSCNTMIMYHIRQQALGNIYMALYLGMRLFLNSKSGTYKYMIDKGVIIFDLEKDFHLIGIELNKNQKRLNKQLVSELQGEKEIDTKIKGLMSLHNYQKL